MSFLDADDAPQGALADAALRASEERYRVAIQTAPDGFLLADLDGRLLDVNPAYCRMSGYSGQELLGMRISDLEAKESPEENRAHILRVIRAGCDRFETRHRRKDGSVFDVEISANYQRIETGRIICFVRDICERKGMEDQLARQVGLFRTALSHLPLGIFMVEAGSGVPLVANDRALEILGRGILPDANEHNLSRVYRAFRAGTDDPYPPDEMPIVQGMYGRSVTVDDLEVERPDGTRVLLEIFGTPVNDENGVPWASLVGFFDISEKKRVEEEIRRLNEELEQRVQERTEALTAANKELADANTRLAKASRAKSDFLASMSHELRTPLNSIIGFSGLLRAGLTGPLSPEQEQQIGIVNSSGRHLLSLVEEILDLSRIESGGVAAQCVEIEVAPLAAEWLEMVRPMAVEKGIELALKVGPEVGWLNTDARLVGQILTNLLGNAVKFTDSGTVLLTVTGDDAGVQFDVSDTGRGIAPEDLSRITERFYQVMPPEGRVKNPGAGLGLAISKQLAEVLGARLEVRSELGQGSTFSLRIPRLRQAGEAATSSK